MLHLEDFEEIVQIELSNLNLLLPSQLSIRQEIQKERNGKSPKLSAAAAAAEVK